MFINNVVTTPFFSVRYVLFKESVGEAFMINLSINIKIIF